MRRSYRPAAALTALLAGATLAVRADVPGAYAIRGARIVTAAGAPIASGTIVIRDGLIEAVGADVVVPPDAVVIDGSGQTAYPGFIDMGTATGIDEPRPAQPQNPRTTEELERWKRSVLVRPELRAADHVQTESDSLHRFAAAGVTTVLARAAGSGISGQSTLIDVVPPEDEPQVGGVGDVRGGLLVVKDRVALHVALDRPPSGGGYPVSQMGLIAFVRQTFLDAQHYQAAQEYYARRPATPRPAYDRSLGALAPALEGRLPVAFEAGLNREIVRALAMAEEFGLDPIITGGLESDQLTAELKARKARVIYSLDYPTRPKSLAPDADEPLRVLRERANAPRTPAALEKAGILFAFESAGLEEPAAFLRNAAAAVKAGLSPEAAVRALTIDAARIAGVADRLGSLEPGKIANVVMTGGDVFGEGTKVTRVFVDGRPVPIEPPAPPSRDSR